VPPLETPPFTREPLEVASILQREAAEPRERDEKARVLFLEDRASSAALLVGKDEHAGRPGSSFDGDADGCRHRTAQEAKVLPAERALATQHLAQELVFRNDAFRRAPRKSDSRLGLAGAPLAEGGQISTRRVQNANGTPQDILGEGLFIR